MDIKTLIGNLTITMKNVESKRGKPPTHTHTHTIGARGGWQCFGSAHCFGSVHCFPRLALGPRHFRGVRATDYDRSLGSDRQNGRAACKGRGYFNAWVNNIIIYIICGSYIHISYIIRMITTHVKKIQYFPKGGHRELPA